MMGLRGNSNSKDLLRSTTKKKKSIPDTALGTGDAAKKKDKIPCSRGAFVLEAVEIDTNK